MSTQEPVIAVLNETSESESVDSPAVPPSEDLVVKDTPVIVDSSPVEPATELPAEATQTASNDTPAILPNHDTNIPDATPTNFNSSASGAEVTSSVSVELLNFFFSLFFPLRSWGGATLANVSLTRVLRDKSGSCLVHPPVAHVHLISYLSSCESVGVYLFSDMDRAVVRLMNQIIR